MDSFRSLRKPLTATAVLVVLAAPGAIGATRFATSSSTVGVSNASLETDANHDKVPDCWQPQGGGSAKAAYTWTTSGHTGSHAEKLSVTRYKSGTRGLFVQMGTSLCGPSVQSGHSYTLQAWYHTDGTARWSTFYRDTSGTWVPWTSGPALPAQGSWTSADYATPALPAGVSELSFGIELTSAGNLTTDDYSLVDTGSTSPSPSVSPSPSPSTSPSGSPTASPTSTSPTSATTSALPSTSAPTSATTSSAPTSATTSAVPTSTAPTSTTTSATTSATPTSVPTSATTSATPVATPPPANGYFTQLVAPGNVAALPSGSTCAQQVSSSTWEPRPDNAKPNHTLVDPAAVHASFAQRLRSGDGGYDYDPRWDTWLLARVDGQFTGTTDQIIQWAACKWGLPDNYLRAEADIESTWFQYETYPSGRCVYQYGCGDWFSSEPYAARKTYCDGLAATGGYDYQKDYGDGLCPRTFSIAGIMSWWNPSWGFNWAGNQDGTFPFTRNSTAMAMDYMASQIRGCYEGWQWELGSSYTAGDLWGCAGAWYSGSWHDPAADTYISHVQADESAKPWLAPSYMTEKPSCDPTYGCPGGTVLP